MSESQRAEGLGQQLFPHALGYAYRGAEDRQLGGQPRPLAQLSSAQLPRKAAGQVSSFQLLRMFFGLGLGAISLQC